MGNTDSIPVVSQMKSLAQISFGDSAAARATQNNFLYNNTFPVTSQLTSLGYAIAGENGKALDLQKKFADDMVRIIDSIPVAGHIKGGVHYALGEREAGDNAMKAASRSTGVVIGGVGGFMGGGPVGAVAGGVAGGASMDGLITGSEILLKKSKAKPYGYVEVGKDIVDAVEKKRTITVEQGFDMAMLPVGDGIAGYTAGRGMFGRVAQVHGKMNGAAPPKPVSKVIISAGDLDGSAGSGGGAAGAVSAASDAASAGKKLKPLVFAQEMADDVVNAEPSVVAGAQNNYLGLDKAALDNRANQLNPNHAASGPGRPAGYQGEGSMADLNNHANQLNPNNPLYRTG